MTVYVDDYRRPATVGRLRGRWSHLTADTVGELHDLAARIGLKRAWFQARCQHSSCPAVCAHFHYDVTDTKRAAAITSGATAIDIRELGAITSARRNQFRAPTMPDATGTEQVRDASTTATDHAAEASTATTPSTIRGRR